MKYVRFTAKINICVSCQKNPHYVNSFVANMLLIDTKVVPSKIHGVGLAAVGFIPKGTVIWMHDDSIDRVYSRQSVNAFSIRARETVYLYGWREGRYYIFPGDNARFTNHSSDPNCGPGTDETSIALRDIQPGEELTEDYSSFDDDFELYAKELTAHSSSG